MKEELEILKEPLENSVNHNSYNLYHTYLEFLQVSLTIEDGVWFRPKYRTFNPSLSQTGPKDS